VSISWEDVCRALRFYRGDEDTGLDHRSAARILVAVRQQLRRPGPHVSDLAFEDALDHALDQARLGRFRGGSPGEAQRWLARIVANRCFDAARRPHHASIDEPAQSSLESGAPGPERETAGREVLAQVRALVARIRLAAGGKRRAIDVFLAYRIDPERAARQLGDSEYQDRSRGAAYFHAVLCELIDRGDVDEASAAIGMAILSGTKMAGRPCPCEDAP
jgi:hypothetical protein